MKKLFFHHLLEFLRTITKIPLRDRKRFNEPADLLPKHPTSRHFADEISKISDQFKNISVNLKNFSDLLKQDEFHEEGNSKENQRRIIQNNLDTLRYCSPLLVNISKLVIPIGNPDGRIQTV